MPLGALKVAWKRSVLRQNELGVSEERIEPGREFQIVGLVLAKNGRYLFAVACRFTGVDVGGRGSPVTAGDRTGHRVTGG